MNSFPSRLNGIQVRPSTNSESKIVSQRKRREQTSFLSLQRKHRNETDCDHQERIEQRSADALGRLDDDLKAFPSGWIVSMLLLEMFERLMGVLHHDNGSVNHRANRDGDSAKGHDVRG